MKLRYENTWSDEPTPAETSACTSFTIFMWTIAVIIIVGGTIGASVAMVVMNNERQAYLARMPRPPPPPPPPPYPPGTILPPPPPPPPRDTAELSGGGNKDPLGDTDASGDGNTNNVPDGPSGPLDVPSSAPFTVPTGACTTLRIFVPLHAHLAACTMRPRMGCVARVLFTGVAALQASPHCGTTSLMAGR
jgi:hypothetical protein